MLRLRTNEKRKQSCAPPSCRKASSATIYDFRTGKPWSEFSGRVKSVTYDSGATVSRVDAALDRFGETVNLTHTFQGSGTTVAFSHAYDKVGRLIATHVSNANWTWIPPANRTLTAVHNNLNEVASVTGTGWTPPTSGQHDFTHDANGNLTGTTSGADHMVFTYDSENRMIAADVSSAYAGASGGTGAFGYDPVGRRDHALIVGSSTRDLYFWTDGDNTIAEYNGAAVGGPWQTSAELRRYVYLPGTYTPFLQIEKATGVRTYLHQDRLGSVIATASATGVKGSVNTYDPYGNMSGSAPTAFGYTGYYYYPELGLYDAHARIYSPFLGRFLQTDPIGYKQSLNLYQYAGGSPNLYTDPSGKFFEEFLAAFILNVALDAIEQLGTNHGRFKIGWNIAFDAAAAIVQAGIGEVVSAAPEAAPGPPSPTAITVTPAYPTDPVPSELTPLQERIVGLAQDAAGNSHIVGGEITEPGGFARANGANQIGNANEVRWSDRGWPEMDAIAGNHGHPPAVGSSNLASLENQARMHFQPGDYEAFGPVAKRLGHVIPESLTQPNGGLIYYPNWLLAPEWSIQLKPAGFIKWPTP